MALCLWHPHLALLWAAHAFSSFESVWRNICISLGLTETDTVTIFLPQGNEGSLAGLFDVPVEEITCLQAHLLLPGAQPCATGSLHFAATRRVLLPQQVSLSQASFVTDLINMADHMKSGQSGQFPMRLEIGVRLLQCHILTAIGSGRIWNMEQVCHLFLQEPLTVPTAPGGLRIMAKMIDWMRNRLRSSKEQRLTLTERVKSAPCVTAAEIMAQLFTWGNLRSWGSNQTVHVFSYSKSIIRGIATLQPPAGLLEKTPYPAWFMGNHRETSNHSLALLLEVYHAASQTTCPDAQTNSTRWAWTVLLKHWLSVW